MDIPIKFYTAARELFGKKQDIVILETGGSVNDLLALLFDNRLPGGTKHLFSSEFPGENLLVFVNEIRTVDTGIMLKEGDRVSLFGALG